MCMYCKSCSHSSQLSLAGSSNPQQTLRAARASCSLVIPVQSAAKAPTHTSMQGQSGLFVQLLCVWKVIHYVKVCVCGQNERDLYRKPSVRLPTLRSGEITTLGAVTHTFTSTLISELYNATGGRERSAALMCQSRRVHAWHERHLKCLPHSLLI